jgi:hypothetical protein
MCRARRPRVFTQGFCFCDNPIPPPASEILTARASRQRSGNRHAVSVAVLRADLSARRCGGLLPLRRIGSEAAVGPDRRLTCLLRLVGPAFCRPACRANRAHMAPGAGARMQQKPRAADRRYRAQPS